MDKILIGIVGYKSENHIFNCLKSVVNQSHKNFDVVYFDNFGADKALNIVSEHFPQVKCIKSTKNLGYGNSHNVIMSEYNYDFYMPLNPDVILEPNFLTEALTVFQKSKEQIGAVNGIILFGDNENKTDLIYSCGHIMHKDRRNEDMHNGMKITEADISPRFIFGPNGACPLFKKEMIIDISVRGNLFDKFFFMYGDDVDVGWRISKAGWKTAFVPECKAWHSVGGSKPFENRKVRAEYIANRYILILKNDSLVLFLRDIPFIILIEILFFSIQTLKHPAFIIDFLCATLKVIKMIPYAMYTRKEITCRTNLQLQSHFIEKKYLQRLKRFVMRQTAKSRNLSNLK